MTDRRTAQGSRLLDPTWHRLVQALDKLYHEIETDAQAQALAATVYNADGTLFVYTVAFHAPGQVHRDIVTDHEALIDVHGAATINADADPGVTE